VTLSQLDVDVSLFDTTALHAVAAVDFALGTPKPPIMVADDTLENMPTLVAAGRWMTSSS
jgi:hypothetical protein